MHDDKNYSNANDKPISPERVGVESADALPLTLHEAIKLALENNYDIRTSRVDVEKAEHSLTARRGAYDPQIFSETYFERSSIPVPSFTGMIGMLLVMLGALVASASMVKEKEVGTVEQLLMTPAGSAEIILAKMAPIFLLLSLDIGLSAAVGNFVFGVPVRGSLGLLYVAGMLCVLSGIGIGTIIATFTRSQQQAQLMSFFVNPPLSMLSGATTPIEAMPVWMQPLTDLNPVKHFAVLARGVMLKGVGMDVLYPNFLALLAFTILLVGVSAWRFRKQLN